MHRRTILLLTILGGCLSVFSQTKKEFKFNPVKVSDFTITSPLIDSNINAVVLADVGSTEFVGNNSGDFSLLFKQHKRILLLNRNAFEAATVKVPVYVGNNFASEEKFEDFEAATYNLENGAITVSKLDKANLFSEKLTREQTIRKFTFPNLRQGCIIDYKYTIKSPYYSRLRPWVFQGEYPCLWSEYRVAIPSIFNYFTTRQGFIPYTVDTITREYKTYTIIDQSGAGSRNDVYRISGNAIAAMWAIKDVPPFKAESYTSTAKNYINKIQFQLSSIQYSENNIRQVVKDWFATSNDMMKDPDFGQQLIEPSGWLTDIVKPHPNDTSAYLQVKRVYEYVRDNFRCKDHDALWLSQPMRKTFQAKTGNVSDINMFLAALLINHGFEAKPVILSTRDNGRAKESTPMLSQYNYVIVRVKIGGEYLLLDASRERLGFGKLTEDCYNISGRVVDGIAPALVNLSPDSLKERKTTICMIINSEKKGFEGSYSSTLGDVESLEVRDKLAGEKPDAFYNAVKKDFPSDMVLKNFRVDSLNQFDEPVKISYEMKGDFDEEDIIYFTPMLGDGIKKNPFAAAERLYPVEMPYPIDENYIFDMEIPKGYKIDEVPKSVRIKLNDEEGQFEYIISVNPGNVRLNCKLQLKKAIFNPEDYSSLRDFFTYVVKKESEQIVFKKIK